MNEKLQDYYDKIERLRRMDDGSALMMRELEKVLGEMKYEVWVESNKRRVAEFGGDK